MTTVRIPVRVRLELDPARPADHLAQLVRDATDRAASRAASRARDVPLVRDTAWHPGPPATTVGFTGDPLPQALEADLAAATQAGLQAAATRLQAAPAGTPRAGAGPAGRPAPATVRLRSFTTWDDIWDGVLSFYRGAPPAEVLVIARLRGAPVQAVIAVDGAGRATVRVAGLFNLFVPRRLGGGEQPAGALDADELRYWRFVGDPVKWHAALVDLKLEKSGDDQFAWPGRMVIYEFLKGGEHVLWHVAPTSFTTGSLPVVVLTEEVRREGYGDCAPLDLTADDRAKLGEPYLGEPHLTQWPVDRDHLVQLMGEIAGRLGMPEGGYVGSFVLVATKLIGVQSEGLGVIGGGTRGRQAELRRLAEISVLVTNLAAAYVDAMYSADRSQQLLCPVAGHSGQWALHFHQFFHRVRRDTVGRLFVAACQDVLLEALEKSLFELDRRLDPANFPQYMRFTRALLLIVLSRSVELEDLRRRIGVVKARNRNAALAWRAPNLLHASWRQTSADVVAAIRDAASDNSPAGAVVFADGKYWAKDDRGHWWNEEQLAFAIGTARDEAFLIDPFLAKIKDLSDVVTRLKDAQRRDDEHSAQQGDAVTEAVDAEFTKVLKDVRSENLDRTARVRWDRSIAFGLASFTEDRTDEIGARLTGIHRLADQRLRPMFAHEVVYTDALHELAAAELGKAELTAFFNVAGIAFLSIFFPPAAFLIGAGQAIGALATAYEHRGIQQALLGGDEIITRAQAEAELWAAWIGAALAFLPLVKPLARGASGAVRLALPGAERRAAGIAAIRLAGKEVAHIFALVTAEDLFGAFLREAVKGYLLNLVLSAAIDRFIDAVVSEDPHGEVSREHLRAVMTEAARAAGQGAP